MKDETLRDELKTVEPINKSIQRDENQSFAAKEVRDKVVESYPDPKIHKDIKAKKPWFLQFLKLSFLLVALILAIMIIIELAKQNGILLT